MKKKLIAIHLLNDRSGSPLVFRQALETLANTYRIHLFTATPSGDGFLSNLPATTPHKIPYRWSPNKWLTLLYFLYTQCWLFLKLVIQLRKEDTVYVNTLLPFGAALAGSLRGCRVIYHIHEVSIRPILLHRFLCLVAGSCAQKIIFVSRYVATQYKFRGTDTQVIHNALPATWAASAAAITAPNLKAPFTVLMLCSLKKYKGVDTFVNIARKLPHLHFQLVLNADAAAVEAFRQKAAPPPNCRLYTAQADTLQFYEQAHLVLNLSDPRHWIETFGMTALEAMACGRPVIVPAVGGVCELVTQGVGGYQIDSQNEDRVVAAIRRMAGNVRHYIAMAAQARQRAAHFSQQAFQQQLASFIATQAEYGKPVYHMEKKPANHNVR